ncbi:hypothetical protein KIN20_023872 [Parelaphostrongylus tenuis]|uniref:Uncharacterized protein n=1 Tax=Parelaphostrongylus tenuis TaxID=148309 RepID=A0AAD5QW20_PARTN|nr:hypothetical protein KIN20_023872 [Parelaphostrongylus tenuis]
MVNRSIERDPKTTLCLPETQISPRERFKKIRHPINECRKYLILVVREMYTSSQ